MSPTTAFQGPPRSCPMCLVGRCENCTGRLTVLDHRNVGRDRRCEHKHPAGRGPIDRAMAAANGRSQ